MTISVTAEDVRRARRPQDLFGENATREEAARVYRELVKEWHPDRLPADATPEERAAAVDSFVHLTKLWGIAQDIFDSGAWLTPGLAGLTVKSKRRTHVIGAKLAEGDIADVYTCGAGVIKIARSPRDTDLMRREVTALKKIRRNLEPGSTSHWYLPRLVDALRIKDAKRVERQANVFEPLIAAKPEDAREWVSLADVIAAYPRGIDPRDGAWMWRRILVVLFIAHDAGFVHHAVFPEHVMILPPEHGVILIDWCYSAELGTPPVAKVSRYNDWYPEEVSAKKPSVAETDIALAARTMIKVLGGNPVTGELPRSVPRGMRAYFRACTLPYASQRPGDAQRLLDSFNQLIERLWGPRRFREFHMPVAS